MKPLIAFTISAFMSSTACAEYVQGYVRQDGRYVQGYNRTAPDNNPYNNYSTQGNINPYTGQRGTVQPQPTMEYPSPYYQQPRRSMYGQ